MSVAADHRHGHADPRLGPWDPRVADRGLTAGELHELGLPLGPGSLTWDLLGDVRSILLAQRAGILQNLHPVISQALVDQSNVWRDPLGRLMRSAGPILGVVYDAEGADTGGTVRDVHRGVRGRDPAGRSYHALDPEAFYWAHATFFESQIATQRLFGTPLSVEQEEQLYRESITWYARYGLSLRPVPRTYEAFRVYWAAMFERVLQATPVARYGLRPIPHQPSPEGLVPDPLWWLTRPAVVHAVPWLGRVTLPREARRLLGVRRSPGDLVALHALRASIRRSWPLVPEPQRRAARARAADRRLGLA